MIDKQEGPVVKQMNLYLHESLLYIYYREHLLQSNTFKLNTRLKWRVLDNLSNNCDTNVSQLFERNNQF